MPSPARSRRDSRQEACDSASILRPEHYLRTPLVADLERLCDPARPAEDALFLNLAAKYFFAYIYEGAQRAVVPLPDITRLFELFARHQSLNEDGDDVQVMNSLRQWTFALRVLADLPRAAHLLRSVALRRLPPALLERPYAGLDMGTGTGVLLLGVLAQARRNGFETAQIWGLECDRAVAGRSAGLVRDLGLGEVLLADAREAQAYAPLRGRALTFVCNETVSAAHLRQRREHLAPAFGGLFGACREQLRDTVFFPEGIIVYNKDMNVSVLLSRANGFQGVLEYGTLDFAPQALFSEGAVLPLHLLGRDFLEFLTPLGRSLARRW